MIGHVIPYNRIRFDEKRLSVRSTTLVIFRQAPRNFQCLVEPYLRLAPLSSQGLWDRTSSTSFGERWYCRRRPTPEAAPVKFPVLVKIVLTLIRRSELFQQCKKPQNDRCNREDERLYNTPGSTSTLPL